MKKKIVIFFIFTLFIAFFTTNYATANAAENNKKPENEVNDLIDEIDFSGLDDYIDETLPFFAKRGSVADYLKSIVNGEASDFNSLTEYAISLFAGNFRDRLPTFISLFVLLIFGGIIEIARPDNASDAGEIAKFAIFLTCSCIVSVIVIGTLQKASEVIRGMAKIIEGAYPILLTLSVSAGAEQSAALISPTTLFVSEAAVSAVTSIVFPCLSLMLVTAIASNLNNSVKFKNLFGFLSSFLKWGIGLFATFFSIFLAVKSSTAVTLDGISYKTAKYALGTSVPLVGGIVRDGLDMLVSSAVTIKNALGALTLAMVFSVAIIPVIEIAVVSLCLKFVAAVTEPFSDGRAGDFIASSIAILNFAIAAIIVVAFLYVSTTVAIINSTRFVV